MKFLWLVGEVLFAALSDLLDVLVTFVKPL